MPRPLPMPDWVVRIILHGTTTNASGETGSLLSRNDPLLTKVIFQAIEGSDGVGGVGWGAELRAVNRVNFRDRSWAEPVARKTSRHAL